MRIKNSFFAPILVIIIYILLFASGLIDVSLLQYKDNIYLSLIIMQLIIFILPAIFYCKIKGEGYFKRLRIRLFSPAKILFIVFAFLVLIFGSSLIKLVLYYSGLYGESFVLYNNYMPSTEQSASNILYAVLTFAVLPAVTEEFVFRSVLISEYEDNGTFCAVIMSSLLFAMLHFNLPQFPIFFFGGLIFALTAIITRSVIASMILHAANNLFSLFLEKYVMRFFEQPQSTVFFVFILIVLFLLSLFAAVSAAERIYYNDGINGVSSPPEIPKEASKSRLFLEAIISPTFLLCILAYFIAALLS